MPQHMLAIWDSKICDDFLMSGSCELSDNEWTICWSAPAPVTLLTSHLQCHLVLVSKSAVRTQDSIFMGIRAIVKCLISIFAFRWPMDLRDLACRLVDVWNFGIMVYHHGWILKVSLNKVVNLSPSFMDPIAVTHIIDGTHALYGPYGRYCYTLHSPSCPWGTPGRCWCCWGSAASAARGLAPSAAAPRSAPPAVPAASHLASKYF